MSNPTDQSPHPPTHSSTPFSTPHDSVDDPKIDTLSDSDDLHFDGESDEDISFFSDGTDSDVESNQHDLVKRTDDQVHMLTQSLQTEFVKQPKSTQLVLIHEVSQLFKSYQQHGSSARLSAAIIAYLDGGDVVMRKTKRDVVEEEYDPKGKKTGRTRVVKQDVTERAQLRFCPLPEVVARDAEPKERIPTLSVGGKRKAEGEVDADVGEKEKFNCRGTRSGAAGDASLTLRDRGSPTNSKTLGKVIHKDSGAMEDSKKNKITAPTHKSHRPPNPPPSRPSRHEAHDSTTQTPSGSGPSVAQAQHSTSPLANNTNTNNTKPIPGLPNITREQYSCTTDVETQALLLDNSIPFNPHQTITLPVPITPLTPPTHAAHISRITSLHAHAASHFHTSLVAKYTIPATAADTNPPQPPAALIRLGIIAKLHSDIGDMYEPATENEFSLGPGARKLFRGMYDVSPGQVNGIEAMVLARCVGCDVPAVNGWWEDRCVRARAWVALRAWVRCVERERIVGAKIAGLY